MDEPTLSVKSVIRLLPASGCAGFAFVPFQLRLLQRGAHSTVQGSLSTRPSPIPALQVATASDRRRLNGCCFSSVLPTYCGPTHHQSKHITYLLSHGSDGCTSDTDMARLSTVTAKIRACSGLLLISQDSNASMPQCLSASIDHHTCTL